MIKKEVVLRDNISIEKGVILSKLFLDGNEELIEKYLNLWILYPDLFLDIIQPQEDAEHFHLYPYQRIALRASMRYRYNWWVATRATAKSFTAYLSAVVRAILLPGSKIMIASDVKGTVIKIAEAKFAEIWLHWPLLRNELTTRQDDGQKGEKKSNSYYDLYFKNGSMITVVAKDTSRGLRSNAAILEEAATIDETSYNEVLLPQMNIARRESSGKLNPNEPTACQTFITTAREKTVFMYGKLIECTINAVLRPDEFFSWGLSYEVPVHYGLIDRATIEDQRYSSNMSDESFARESMSIWTGNNSEAWFNSNRLTKRRTLLRCEREGHITKQNPDAFYILGVDLARYQANTAIMVIKVLPGKEKYKKNVVYTEVIHGENYITVQAPRIKKLIDLYNPKEVVIDGNGRQS